MFQNQVVAMVMPALNEARSLPAVLGAVPGWVDRVVVADNGSTDQTASVAKRHGAMVVVESMRGYGAACLAGIRAAADADILVFLDADFSDDPAQMERLVQPIVRGEADLVIGSRTLGRCERGSLSVQQRFGNALACGLMRLFWNHRYTDLGPFRAIRTDALEPLGMDDRNFGWTIQMQIRALRAGLRVAEVPVDYRRRIGVSKISGTLSGVLRAGTKILGTIAQERLSRPAVTRLRPEPEHLSIFTRYPAPGEAKTRLIPALGAEGAAKLQRGMTRRALAMTDALAARRPCSVELRFAGGDYGSMRDSFGERRLYLRQGGGDLGERIHRAFVDSFKRGAHATLVIGSDCPSLDPHRLESAFAALRDHDVVLGPARDGGYYLIGLRRPCAALFDGINWGSAVVFTQTVERAKREGLSLHTLDVLSDIDEPSDVLENAHLVNDVLSEADRPRLSIIIPALNEARYLGRCLDSISHAPEIERMVVDGGSSDDTVEIARAHGAIVVAAARGRATQMNAGAAHARGESLMFLHADTCLPPGGTRDVLRLLSEPGVALAAFRLGIDGNRHGLRWIERLANSRSRWLGMPYGDQAICVRSEDFRRLGGFREMPLMEDFEFVRRARRAGAVRLSRLAVLTSARRWRRDGILRTTLTNQLCILGGLLGVSPDALIALRERCVPDRRIPGYLGDIRPSASTPLPSFASRQARAHRPARIGPNLEPTCVSQGNTYDMDQDAER